VEEAFRDRFLATDAGYERFFEPGAPGHFQFDLEAFAADRLEDAGVGGTERLGLDTYSSPERFYSFRRATHLEQPAYGRQISLIGLA
jgi:polyphenol oxidase